MCGTINELYKKILISRGNVCFNLFKIQFFLEHAFDTFVLRELYCVAYRLAASAIVNNSRVTSDIGQTTLERNGGVLCQK